VRRVALGAVSGRDEEGRNAIGPGTTVRDLLSGAVGRSRTALSPFAPTRGAVNTGALVVGLITVAAGGPSIFGPQAVIDWFCAVNPLCSAPRQLSPAGVIYNRIVGGGVAPVGLLLVVGALVGTID
jgi:hypothetical protein